MASIAAGVAVQNAIVHAWTGEWDVAIHQLETLAKIPGSLGPGDLKFSPEWDELRSDPRFEEIIAEASKPIDLDHLPDFSTKN